ncbi:hypothetical protein [Rhodovulum strictum]|uniref:Uncharacterized protein n=1 Tax=Rhodovulum strictum TaxID=58314 RepID=A0A844BIT0_9RHOB|nr:hypothetical protein [Rhodovulum strictum]MRH21445.1 hypothetical protein [Rhodovulum strictum]
MVEIAEIRDEESFKAWLEQEDLPKDALVALAHRAAMRVLPIWWAQVHAAEWVRQRELTALPSLRCALISGLTTLGATPEIRASAAADAAHAYPYPAAAADVAAEAATSAVAAALTTVRTVANTAAAAGAAAVATAHAADAAADAWTALREDCAARADVPRLMATPLWHEAERPFDGIWHSVRTQYPPDGDHPWAFWIDWYQRALDGTETRWDLLRKIALIDNAIWEAGPEAVAAEIVRLQGGERTPLARAYPVDFTFDALLRVMRMVGIDDDMRHLHDPSVVRAFLDNCEELRDKLQDFADYASDLSGGGNSAGVLKRAAQKVLSELQRTEDFHHLRARRIVELAGELELFSKEERARADLGQTLSLILDNAISLLRDVTRRHFGPSYTALAPLSDLSLDHVDQDAVIALFDDMIGRMEALPSNELVALDQDGLNVFRDMLREAREFRAAIAEASTDAFREVMEARFAESLGSTGLAVGRFIEKSSEAAGKAGAVADWTERQFKRVTSLADIVEAIRAYFNSGGGIGMTKALKRHIGPQTACAAGCIRRADREAMR